MRKPPNANRAPLPRRSDYSRKFETDRQRLSRAGRHDMRALKAAMPLLIANDAPLAPEWLDLALKGDWVDHRE